MFFINRYLLREVRPTTGFPSTKIRDFSFDVRISTWSQSMHFMNVTYLKFQRENPDMAIVRAPMTSGSVRAMQPVPPKSYNDFGFVGAYDYKFSGRLPIF